MGFTEQTKRGAMFATGLTVALLWLPGCAGGNHGLVKASAKLGKAVKKGDEEAIEAQVLIGSRRWLRLGALADEKTAKTWSQRLKHPSSARPEVAMFLGEGNAVDAVWTDDGWRFASDPSDYYAQGSPREALRSLVRATMAERWDVMLELAPRRYRVGLSEEDLAKAWTDGPEAAALRARRDRVAKNLGGTIRADAHQAILDLGKNRFARLEREGDRWVVVDF